MKVKKCCKTTVLAVLDGVNGSLKELEPAYTEGSILREEAESIIDGLKGIYDKADPNLVDLFNYGLLLMEQGKHKQALDLFIYSYETKPCELVFSVISKAAKKIDEEMFLNSVPLRKILEEY